MKLHANARTCPHSRRLAVGRVERNAMIHDHQRERSVADRPHQIGEHWKRQRQRPDLFLDAAGRSLIVRVRRRDKAGEEQQ